VNDEEAIVAVIDDDVSMRESINNLLRSIGLKVQTFGSAPEFFSSPSSEAAACLVLDVRLPGASGLDIQHELKAKKIQIPIIFITGYGDIPMSVRAMKGGAVEFLTKPFRDQEFLDAVQQALDRGKQERRERTRNAELQKLHSSLTVREREVFALVVQGRLNKQIADELSISEPTVKLHRGRVMQKMRADSLADLIRMAEKLGIGPNYPKV